MEHEVEPGYLDSLSGAPHGIIQLVVLVLLFALLFVVFGRRGRGRGGLTFLSLLSLLKQRLFETELQTSRP